MYCSEVLTQRVDKGLYPVKLDGEGARQADVEVVDRLEVSGAAQTRGQRLRQLQKASLVRYCKPAQQPRLIVFNLAVIYFFNLVIFIKCQWN